MIKWFKYIALIGLIPTIYVVIVLLYATATDYQPEAVKSLPVFGKVASLESDSIMSCVIWNIGFTGLGAETDFFYDGGKVVTQTEELVAKNRQGVLDFVKYCHNATAFMFQETDSCSKRSHYVDMTRVLNEVLPNYEATYAANYDVKFVPIPFTDPMGKVHSGLASYFKGRVLSTERHRFDSQFSWPQRLFFLDRCFSSHIVEIKEGVRICFINTHCSAYDTSGTMVANEIQRLMSFADSIHTTLQIPVIIGGDWNQCPPEYNPVDPKKYNEYKVSDNQLPAGWRWISDTSIPTNRKLNEPYIKGKSYTSVIDFYAVSPDVEVVSVETVDLDFAFSDHQPVELRFTIKSKVAANDAPAGSEDTP